MTSLLSILALCGQAVAQSQPQDLEYREPEIEEEPETKLQTSAFFETQWYEFSNLDFRAYDDSSDQAILDSDDRSAFAFTGAAFDLGYDVDDRTRFVLGITHRGLWGNDQIGNVNAFGGWIYVTALYTDVRLGTGDKAPLVRIGRQFYDLGGLNGGREFILADILDMVRVDIPLGESFKIVAIPINVISASTDNDGADFVSYIGQSAVQTFNFQGDRMTRRHGIVLEANDLADVVDARAYVFYTDVGALGSGSDISYNGLLGNFSDNDWVANYGARASASIGPVRPFAEFDLSSGIDRKELVAADIDANGWAVGAGALVQTGSALSDGDSDDETGLRAELSFFRALGPYAGSNGLMLSHGYVGMKAQQVGGTLFNRFLGFHPTAYVSMFGVTDNAQDQSRKSGTQVLHARVGYELPGPLRVSAAWWLLSDTGSSDVANLDTITPPFGYAREEFAAQERLGKALGQEIDLDLGVQVTDHLDMFANGAVILPGAFYGIEIARVAGTALGALDPEMPWSINAGTRLRF